MVKILQLHAAQRLPHNANIGRGFVTPQFKGLIECAAKKRTEEIIVSRSENACSGHTKREYSKGDGRKHNNAWVTPDRPLTPPCSGQP